MATRLDRLEQEHRLTLQRAQMMLDLAQRENRALTTSEETTDTGLLQQAGDLQARLDREASDVAMAAQIEA